MPQSIYSVKRLIAEMVMLQNHKAAIGLFQWDGVKENCYADKPEAIENLKA